MTDQPESTTAPAAAPAVVKVIPARKGFANGVEVDVPATVSVDGKPVARCEDEAIAHLVAAIYQKGEGVVEALKDSAEKVASLEGLIREKADQINELTDQIGSLQRELKEEQDEAAAANQVIEGRDATIAELEAVIEGYRKQVQAEPIKVDDPVTAVLGDSDGGKPTGENTEPPKGEEA